MTASDIVVFLTRCLDEDQALTEAALAHDPAPWTADASDMGAAGQCRTDGGHGLVINGSGESLWDCEGSSTLCMTAPTARFAAANDPARVLADIAAKRKRLAEYEEARAVADDLRRTRMESAEYAYSQGYYSGIAKAVRLDAMGFADRPGYNPDWAVS